MQRYGYEGYPIVRDGKVIGLLNRRSVDRAVAHRLDLTAASLMDAGEVTVHPQDSLEHVRDVMINTGWGQVPVIEPDTDEIVGIVTRTDLLKHMTGHDPLPGRTNLARQLEESLPPARLILLKEVAAEARRLRQALYIVGGYVRDLLLGRPGVDFDLVVEGDAIALARSLENQYGGRVLAHNRFGTSKWTLRPFSEKFTAWISDPADLAGLPDTLDLISARTEFYDYPTALPTVERSSIKLDLHRRDFTINTMALRLDGSHYGDLYDYWGGLRDLKARQVRVLHSLSFVDDPTRQLRAVRFEQRFGFSIEARTLELMREGHPLIRSLSGDRLRHEMNLILQEEKAPAMLARLDDLGLLTAIHPDLVWSQETAVLVSSILITPLDPAWDLPERFANLPSSIALAYLVWLCRLPVEKAFGISDRLRLPGALNTSLVMACQLLHERFDLENASPSKITDRLDSIPPLALYAVYQLVRAEDFASQIKKYITIYRKIQPITTGAQLLEMRIPPGPIYKQILGKLRSAWLDGQISTLAEENEMLDQFIAQLKVQD
jgi:tRNA nucleotidyltransferase (CCA-adding enzyme)